MIMVLLAILIRSSAGSVRVSPRISITVVPILVRYRISIPRTEVGIAVKRRKAYVLGVVRVLVKSHVPN